MPHFLSRTSSSSSAGHRRPPYRERCRYLRKYFFLYKLAILPEVREDIIENFDDIEKIEVYHPKHLQIEYEYYRDLRCSGNQQPEFQLHYSSTSSEAAGERDEDVECFVNTITSEENNKEQEDLLQVLATLFSACIKNLNKLIWRLSSCTPLCAAGKAA